MEFTGERFMPGQGGAQIAYEHLLRYLFAREVVTGKRVLDLGCGEGYGAFLLAQRAQRVIGIDVAPVAAAYAASKYAAGNLRFVVGSALDVPLVGEHQFDIVTCFEVLEHVADSEKLVSEAKRMLRTDGILIISTPNKKTYSDDPQTRNPFHVREFYLHGFLDLLRARFKHLALYGESLSFGASMWNLQPADRPLRIGEHVVEVVSDTLAPVREVQPPSREPTYFVAVCSDHPIPDEFVYRAVYFNDQSYLMRSEFEAAVEDRDRLGGRVETLEADLAALQHRAEQSRQAYSKALEELRATQESVAWRAIVRYRTVIDRFLPAGTFRRQAYHRIIGAARNALGARRRGRPPEGPPAPSTPAGIGLPRRPVHNARGPGVDIILPVYNGLPYLRECLQSVVRHTDLTVHRLVIIDDASPDADVRDYVTHFCAARSPEANITLLLHEANLGFVKSINEGFRWSARDVVLLNSDTVVTAGWVERLQRAAYSAWNIATVTPLSNNATICSIPEFNKENNIPGGFTIESFGTYIDRISLRYYPRIPTAVGFCMYVRRKVLDEIGVFDEAHFGRGYGEENDFCMRAARQGWVHVLDDATYVYHKGGASFPPDIRSSELDQHLTVLARIHPDYAPMVNQFITENPLRFLHAYLKMRLQHLGTSETPG